MYVFSVTCPKPLATVTFWGLTSSDVIAKDRVGAEARVGQNGSLSLMNFIEN